MGLLFEKEKARTPIMAVVKSDRSVGHQKMAMFPGGPFAQYEAPPRFYKFLACLG